MKRLHLRTAVVAMALAGEAAMSACGGARPIHSVVPAPLSVERPDGDDFVVSASTVISVTPGDEHASWVARYLSEYVGLAAGETAPRVDGVAMPASGMMHLAIGPVEGAGDEGYDLRVASDRVTLTANHAAGLFYGVQTLKQLLPAFVAHEAYRAAPARPIRIAPIHVVDRPRFAWRGAMLDVARHFFTVDDVKRYIDLISAYKLNRLHLHLADDQGWRIEIRSWANLTTTGGSTEVGGGPGGFYTQAQYADIVAYARDRFVTIVPEIDLPGHTNAALASYAELNCDGVARSLYTGIEVGFSALCVDKDITYKFIDDVVREIAAMTPGPYFHVGGDEVKTLTGDQYRAFIERVQGIVQSHGKHMIGWDEIQSINLLPTTIVQHWQPEHAPKAAVERGAKIVVSVANRAYLDMKYDAGTPLGQDWSGLIDVQAAYNWDPATVAEGIPEASILGVEAPIWTETLASMRDVELMAFPRLPAIAEVAWSTAARDWPRFRQRLAAQAPYWTALGVNFHRAPGVDWAP